MSNEHLPEFKIVFVGDSAVGKTSIIKRYHHNTFSEENQSTIGAAFISKDVVSPHGSCILHIWDTAGQERYKSLVPMYARGATVALIVFDASDTNGFERVEEWVSSVREDVSSDCSIIIVGNKIDLPQQFNRNRAEDWAKQNNLTIIYVSAKSGQGIDILFQTVISSLPKAKFLMTNRNDDDDVIQVQKTKKGCC